MNEALTLIFIALLSRSAFAINCFSCESSYEAQCGEDNFDAESHFKLDCVDVVAPRFLENEIESMNATACMKKVYMENDELKVVRSCFFGEANSTSNSCSQDPALELVEDISCDICDDNSYCNGANEVLSTFLKYFCVIPAVFMVLLIKLY